MAERNEINSVIKEEMKNMSNALLQLGQAYYEKYADDFDPEFEAIITAIKYSEERVAGVCMQAQEEAVIENDVVPEYDDTVPEIAVAEELSAAPVLEMAEETMQVPVTETVAESFTPAETENIIPVTEPPVIPVMPVMAPAAPVAVPVTETAPECCMKCGAVFEQDAAFCNNCGAPKSASVNDELIVCPSCKQMIRPGTNFCTSCGSAMPSAMPVMTGAAPSIPKTAPEEAVMPVMAPTAPATSEKLSMPSFEEAIYTPSEEFEVVAESAVPQQKTCPSCGAPIIQEGPFCTSCGNRLN